MTDAQHSTLPYTPPTGWAGFGVLPSRKANIFVIVFGVIALLSLLGIVTSGNVASGLTGAAIFGLLALAGWGLGRAGRTSRRPTELMNSVVMTDASVRTPDNWVHLARIRPVPWTFVLTFGIIGALSAGASLYLFFGPQTMVDDAQTLIIVRVIGAFCAVGALFFLWAAAASIITQMRNTGWPRRFGITLGASGIAYRLVGESRDIPWEDVTAVEAHVTNADNARRQEIPVLRIVTAQGTRDYNVAILGVAPVMLYNALRFYRDNPAARAELGTVAARDRMAGWIG